MDSLKVTTVAIEVISNFPINQEFALQFRGSLRVFASDGPSPAQAQSVVFQHIDIALQ